MKFKRPIYSKIFTPNMLRDPQEFFKRIHHYCNSFPEMLPEKYGFWEPLKIPFSPDIIEKMIPNDRGGAADRLLCQRLKKPRYQGSFWPSLHGETHSEEYLTSEFTQIDQHKLINYLKTTTLQFNADLAIIDANRHSEPQLGIKEGWRGVTPFSHELKHWLPDMYWGTVFGKPYVDLFGLECLLSTPAYKVEKLSDDAVYIQLTEQVQDIFEKTEHVDEQREIVKHHLGSDAFWSPEKAYVINTDYRVLKGLSEHNVIHIPLQTNYTDVFRVPHFNLISDAYMQAEVPPENIYTYLKEIKEFGTDQWIIQLSQAWLLRMFDPIALGYGVEDVYSHGEVSEIEFFYKPDGYDAPIEKELFIGAWDRPEQETMSRQKYAESILQVLASNYPLAQSEWSNVESKVDHFEEYSEVYLDQIDQQEFNLFRIAIKVIVFERFFVKVTFMDYWCNDLSESQEISNPIFNSFKAK
ncbi:hypothetical protein [Acinetobacter baumannii]|uniref:hypothetical protein n=1 Tax=Acinetobacter baumannii TaxID=470 RepID=UPI0032198A70